MQNCKKNTNSVTCQTKGRVQPSLAQCNTTCQQINNRRTSVLRLQIKQYETRSTGTVHTSAKARLTSVVIQIRIPYLNQHQNIIICSLAN